MPNKRDASDQPKTAPRATGREDRLKAALKANIARRKQQAKARSQESGADGSTDTQNKEPGG